MSFTPKQNLFSRAIVVTLAVVLVVLAVLQYRWSNAVSEASTARMKASLQSSMMSFRQDLTRELATICLELQPDHTANSIDESRYVRQLHHWQQTSSHPGLVGAVYLWQFSPNKSPSLQRLDAGSDSFQAIAAPAAFAQLGQKLQSASPQIASAPRPDELPGRERFRADVPHEPFSHGPHHGPPGWSNWVIDQHIPALIQPLTPLAAPTPNTVVWFIIELSPTVLKQHILPELAQRYFSGPDGLVYDVAISATDDGETQLIFGSDSLTPAGSKRAPDAVLSLWGPPGPPPGAGAPGPFNDFRSMPPPHLDEGMNLSRADFGFAAPIHLEPIHYSSDQRDWQLAVRHRAGSVEAAVAAARRRNLIVSFGILLLLAVTMGLIVITSHRAQELARLQMDFVAGVSHELRTPLAVISSAAANISDGVVSNSDQLARYGNVIQTQARQLNHLVEQVLQFAATRNRNHNYPISAIDVSSAIDEAVTNTQAVIESAGFSLTCNLEPDLPPVNANVVALSQILQNLITNAIKYGGDSRWIGLRAFRSTALDSTPEVRITVEDKGLGIAPADLEHVFEPFYRSPSVAGSSIHGTGLGLPLAKNIAENIGGRLTVKSHPGEGSTFTVHLRIAADAVPQTDAAPVTLAAETTSPK